MKNDRKDKYSDLWSEQYFDSISESKESLKKRTKSRRRKQDKRREIIIFCILLVICMILIHVAFDCIRSLKRAFAEDTSQLSVYTKTRMSSAMVINSECSTYFQSASQTDEIPEFESRYSEINMSESERHELAAVIFLEAAGEPSEGQQAVAEVILNRVLSPDFPDNVHDVLHEGENSGVLQFSSIKRLSKAEPTEKQYNAIDKALYGTSILPLNVLFFSLGGENENVWGQIGSHIFCYEYD